jgi:hypothetical protein
LQSGWQHNRERLCLRRRPRHPIRLRVPTHGHHAFDSCHNQCKHRRHLRRALPCLCLPARGHNVALRRHVRIDYLTTLVDGSLEVVPAAADPSVGLVYSPVRTHGRSILASYLAEERQIALHPAIDGALISEDAALGRPFTDFSVTEAIAHVPADGRGNDVVRDYSAYLTHVGAREPSCPPAGNCLLALGQDCTRPPDTSHVNVRWPTAIIRIPE